MASAQLYQGTWEQIAQYAQLHRGSKNLTLIVPIEDAAPPARPDEEREAARVAAIHAGRGSLVSDVSLVDELHKERQRDKMREEQEIAQWFMPSTQGQ